MIDLWLTCFRNWIVNGLILISPFFLSTCATYKSETYSGIVEFEKGNYTRGADLLKEKAHQDNLNQLLYLLDRAIILHSGKLYSDAIEDLTYADQLAEVKDYTSLTNEAASIVLNESVQPYKGEDFEKILINVYLAMDYLLMEKYEDALVECRRINDKLYRFINEGKKPYKQNAFARYLSGLIYESEGEYNDAYVDYKEAHRLEPGIQLIKADLLRLSKFLRFEDDFNKWKTEFKVDGKVTVHNMKSKGEIVLLLEVGWSPEKLEHPSFRLMPKFYPRRSTVQYVDVLVDGIATERSEILFDIEKTAIKELDDKITLIVAKKVAGVVAKEVISEEIRKQNEVAGALVNIFLRVTDHADLRSWLTLPKNLQVARVRLQPGEHHIKLKYVNASGGYVGEYDWGKVTVKPTQKTFINHRVF